MTNQHGRHLFKQEVNINIKEVLPIHILVNLETILSQNDGQTSKIVAELGMWVYGSYMAGLNTNGSSAVFFCLGIKAGTMLLTLMSNSRISYC